MATMRKGLAATAVLAAASLTLVACGGSSDTTPSTDGGSGTPSSSAPLNQTVSVIKPGGTINYTQEKGPEHLDPQRVYIGRDISNLGRLVYRSLVAFPPGDDSKTADVPQPDLATDTGTSNKDATQWKFTLKSGVDWQDGKPITCADLKYGVSRTFATDVITGGPNYILGYLDIPTDPKTGQPIYTGPYQSTPAGIAAFNKAVTCDGQTITYNFKKPWPDFPLAIAALPAFDPYRKDQDKGAKSDFTIFSDGPYKVDGTVDPNKGFTLVRNTAWDPSTDSIRKAYPDEFKFIIGPTAETQYQQLIQDDDPDAVTVNVVPSADYGLITPAMADRTVKINSPYTDYILPNFNSKVMQNPMVREALAMSTNRAGWSAALGGPNASIPASSIVNPAVPGYAANPEFEKIPTSGDPAAAKALLTSSGVTMPVPIKFTYPGGSPEAENAAAALKATWDQAGFDTTLNELPNTYYSVVQNPDFKSDVLYGGWGSDWPSISTVIPPLFDSRINLTASSTGQDYGNFDDPAVNKAMDAAGALTDLTKADAAYAAIDATLGKEVAYIPLDISQFYYLHGSNVTNYLNSASTSSYPDLAVIGLTNPSE